MKNFLTGLAVSACVVLLVLVYLAALGKVILPHTPTYSALQPTHTEDPLLRMQHAAIGVLSKHGTSMCSGVILDQLGPVVYAATAGHCVRPELTVLPNLVPIYSDAAATARHYYLADIVYQNKPSAPDLAILRFTNDYTDTHLQAISLLDVPAPRFNDEITSFNYSHGTDLQSVVGYVSIPKFTAVTTVDTDAASEINGDIGVRLEGGPGMSGAGVEYLPSGKLAGIILGYFDFPAFESKGVVGHLDSIGIVVPASEVARRLNEAKVNSVPSADQSALARAIGALQSHEPKHFGKD